MSTPYLASDVMDEAASLLNDTAKTLFTYAAQLPYLRRANEALENLLIACGISVQRQVSLVMTVAPSAVNIDLTANGSYPTDILLPIRCWERDGGSNSQTFSLMTERDWEPELNPTTSATYWTFRNNKIYIPGVTSSRDIKVDYWRQLTSITGQNSNEEVAGAKTFLAAKTAEMCARYIGQNKEVADDLLNIEVGDARDLLERIYIKNTQGTRSRRRRFSRPRANYSR